MVHGQTLYSGQKFREFKVELVLLLFFLLLFGWLFVFLFVCLFGFFRDFCCCFVVVLFLFLLVYLFGCFVFTIHMTVHITKPTWEIGGVMVSVFGSTAIQYNWYLLLRMRSTQY